MVVPGGVEGEVAEEFAGGGVDDADVEVGDEDDDVGSGVFSSDADVVQAAVVAQRDLAGGIDAVVADPFDTPSSRATSAWERPSSTTAVMINRFFDTPAHDHQTVSYDATDGFPMSWDSTPPPAPCDVARHRGQTNPRDPSC